MFDFDDLRLGWRDVSCPDGPPTLELQYGGGVYRITLRRHDCILLRPSGTSGSYHLPRFAQADAAREINAEYLGG